MVVGLYQREWRPSGETQLARRVQDKGGVKAVENSDSALSELAGLDSDVARKVCLQLFHRVWMLIGFLLVGI